MLLFIFVTVQVIGYLLSLFIKNKSSGLLFCGLFGYSGKNPADLTKLRWLATLNQSRGSHSTGVFGVKGNKTQERLLYKNNVCATDFVKDKEAIEAMRAVMTLLGHTRHATQGAQTKENAHPFLFDLGEKTVGAHNGFVVPQLQARYLKDYKLSDKDLPLNNGGLPEVDSMLIVSALSKMKGDYNILPTIEGGINLLFMLPDKYENILFAYKRPARSLHYGISQEGIYISSEYDPLTLIGCTKVMELVDHTITLFRDGEVLDIISLPKPKIHVPLNATRSSLTLSQTEREAYEELRNSGTGTTKQSDLPFETTKYSHVKPKHRSWPKKNDVVEPDHYDDRKKLIVQDIIEEIDLLAPSATLQLPVKNSTYIEIDDLLDGLLMVNLIDSAKKEGLPAWVVMDKDNQLELSGLTGVNGSTVIKYEYIDLRDSGTKRVIQLVSPVNSQTVWEFPVEVNAGRVVEVTLQLPFPQTQANKAADSTSTKSKGQKNGGSSKTGGFNETGELFDSTSSPSLLPVVSGISDTLSKQGKQIYLGCEKKETDGKLGSGDGDSKTNSRVAAVHRKRSNAITAENIALHDTLKTIKKEEPFFNFGADQMKLRYSQEYTNPYQCFRYFLGYLINVSKLFSDAAIIKISEQRKHPTNLVSFSVPHYAIMLLNLAMLDYVSATKLADISMIAKRIFKFVEKWESGENLQSKLGLVDPITYERLSASLAIPTIATINNEISDYYTAQLKIKSIKERSEGGDEGK